MATRHNLIHCVNKSVSKASSATTISARQSFLLVNTRVYPDRPGFTHCASITGKTMSGRQKAAQRAAEAEAVRDKKKQDENDRRAEAEW